ncbi:pilus assembly protein CpaE [Nakamurella sp. GG22]
MISVELASALKAAGLVWHPATGDRFTLLTGAFDGEVFTLSDMVVEAHESRTGTVLGFNGTTEWALDATEASDALWLPREDQLRGLLAASFRSLERVDEGYRVTTVLPGHPADEPGAYWGTDPSEAYARALLALIRRATS